MHALRAEGNRSLVILARNFSFRSVFFFYAALGGLCGAWSIEWKRMVDLMEDVERVAQ